MDKPNIVVVLCDSLRADRLGCYGGPPANSTFLDHFASESLVFEQCCAAASWTKPAVASVFTGVLPRVHQAVVSVWNTMDFDSVPAQMLRENFLTLAEGLRGAGYSTGWFLANPQAAGELGFIQGFDYYNFCVTSSVEQMSDVLCWLSSNPPEPFFLFIHVLDPHEPYQPSEEEYRTVFGRDIEEDIDVLPEMDRKQLANYHYALRFLPRGTCLERPPLDGLSDEGVAHVQRLYDATISRADRQFRQLCDGLRQRGFYDRTAVLFTSDHGESFGEHNFFYHGNCLFDAEIRIPLLLHLPGMGPGRRIPYTVSQCDLYPTLAALGGFEAPPYVQGSSWLSPEWEIAVKEDRTVFADLDFYRADTNTWNMAAIRGGKKLLLSPQTRLKRLFDRYADPGETTDLWDARLRNDPDILSVLQSTYDNVKQTRQLAEAFGPPQWTQMPDEQREEIEALGYL